MPNVPSVPVPSIPAAASAHDVRAPANHPSAGDPEPAVEVGGPAGPEPTRFGDWEKNGRCIDFQELSLSPPRPLSPHLGVYRFMYTMALSILHRITGVAISFAFLLFAWWLMALAAGPDTYSDLVGLLRTPLFKLLLAGFVLAFIYHFCNGIRHLVWDTGRGLERVQARRSGRAVIVATLVLFALFVWWVR